MSDAVSALSPWVSTLQLLSIIQRCPSSSTQASAWLSVISIMTVPGSCVAISTLSTYGSFAMMPLTAEKRFMKKRLSPSSMPAACMTSCDV